MSGRLKAYIVTENVQMLVEHCVLAESAEDAKRQVEGGGVQSMWSASHDPHKTATRSVKRAPLEDPSHA